MCAIHLFFSSVYSNSTSDNLNGIVSTFDSIANVFVSMGSAFEAMGGVVPQSQIYNFVVFNGASKSVTAQFENYKSIMGARTDNGLGGRQVLQPWTDTGSLFFNVQLYFSITIPEASYLDEHLTLGVANDPLVNLYHVFERSSGIGAELVTSCTKNQYLTSDFTSTIYNSSSSSFPLQFTLVDTLFSSTLNLNIPLEAGIFHTLKSHNELTLRPNVFPYTGGNVIVTAQGLGTSGPSTDPTNTSPVITPMTYHYEILSNQKMVEAGFNPGNFAQPVTPQIRDVTPIKYTVWAAQATDMPASGSSNLNYLTYNSSQSVWFVYTGSAYSVTQKKIVNSVVAKIPFGQAISFYLLRPSIKKNAEKIYIFAVNGPNDACASSLVQQISALPLPAYSLPTLLNSSDVSTILNTKLPDHIGNFSVGTTTNAYVLFQKTIIPYAASAGPFYCTITPPLGDATVISNTIQQYLDPLKATSTVLAALSQNIPTWVGQYIQNPTALAATIQSYLLQYGASTLINPNKTLTALGSSTLMMIMYGPFSFANMPLLYFALSDSLIQPASLVPQSNWTQF